MKNIECYLPDINFKIIVPDEFYEEAKQKISQSMIKYSKDNERYITLEYIVDSEYFERLKEEIENTDGNIHNSFINQTHKEVQIRKKSCFLVNTEEYICIKENDLDFKILVNKNNQTSLNWIVRIIRELYLREKEDKEYAFMHGTGLVVNGKGILILGNSGSGKTTLAVKLLEDKGKKEFLSNDRIFINEERIMDYFPQAVTYAMGTVKNNKHLDNYFRSNKILEKNKNVNYETVSYDFDCNTPLTDVAKVFENTQMVARAELDTIIMPKFIKEMDKVEMVDLSNEEKRKILESTNFTPDDVETYRIPWLRKRYLKRNELLEIRRDLIEAILKDIDIKAINYGAKTKTEDIIEIL